MQLHAVGSIRSFYQMARPPYANATLAPRVHVHGTFATPGLIITTASPTSPAMLTAPVPCSIHVPIVSSHCHHLASSFSGNNKNAPFDGDSALVDHSRCDPVEGEIFALRTLEGPLVKRLRFHDERWWASSDNDSSENGSRPLDGDDGIIGRVVWWAHTIVEGEPQPATE